MRVFCFSGSGNSYWVATEVAAHFSVNPELISSFRDKSSVEVADSQIGIIAPIYLNDIPKNVKEFILKLSFADPYAYIFTVLTSSSGKNKSGFKNTDLALAQHNARLALAYDISMPSSFQERIDMDSVLSAASEKVTEIFRAVEEKHENYTSYGSTMLPKNFTQLSFMYKLLSRMSVTEKCVGCGLCYKLCPTNNLVIQDGKAARGKNCIACTSCASWCPQHAIRSRLLKGQYHHPQISALHLLPLRNEGQENEC